MRVVILRHGKVDFQWRRWSTSEQFDIDCKMYDKAPIFPLPSDISQFGHQDIYISSLQRSRETANQLFGEKDFISTKLLDEVPLCASISSNNRVHASRKNSIAMNIKLPLVFWNITARLQWLLNIHVQKECSKETICRAEKIIKMIEEKGNDCILVTHGFFMHTLLKQMRKQGFKRSHTRLSYANGEFVIAVK